MGEKLPVHWHRQPGWLALIGVIAICGLLAAGLRAPVAQAHGSAPTSPETQPLASLVSSPDQTDASGPTPSVTLTEPPPAGTPAADPSATDLPTAPPSPNPSATPGATPTPGPTASPKATASATLDASPSPSASMTASHTALPSTTAAASVTPSLPATSTPSASPSAEPPTPVPPDSVLINEIAWSGTHASANDEWIELHNAGSQSIDLGGWRLTDSGDINVALRGVIAPFGYFLLERTDDTTVSDLAADQIYTGSLRNTGERLELRGPGGELVDSANAQGGGWPAGEASSRFSMERRGGSDLPGNWSSFTGFEGNGLDANGKPIAGTPRRRNSLFVATPTPTAIPSRVVINEVLIRPRHDWEGTGGVTTADEFIELYNAGALPVYLKGWWLDDGAGAGSSPADLPGVTISPRGYAVFFRSQTKIALNDSGDTVRLLAPNGALIDQISYLRVRAYNLSFGRLPDGSDNFLYGLWPTPRRANLIFEEPLPALPSGPFYPWVCAGNAWLAGGQIVRASMERLGPGDDPASWAPFIGPWNGGRDADGARLSGSPGGPNSVWREVEIRPGSDWPPVAISEIFWRGSRASAADEWIELFNATDQSIDLTGWQLIDGNDLRVDLKGSLAGGAFALLERDDERTVSDLPADLIYRGSLSDKGETLWLLDAAGLVVDSANAVRPGVPNAMLARAQRTPAQFAWLRGLDLVTCAP